MIEFVEKIGKSGISFCSKLGQSAIFLWRVVCCRLRLTKLFSLLVEQLYSVGVLSLIIIIVSGVFIGMVLALQGYSILERFGSAAQLGQLIALSVVRELGPVIGGLLFAGRAGSALTAEIGLMQTTEQFSSMEMMGIDPMWRIISPRLLAGIISLPILVAIFCMVAVGGGYMIGVEWLGVDAGQFWANMQASVDFKADVLNGLIKSLVFGVLVTWVAVYQGYYTVPNAAGISRATTKTVVYGSLLVLAADFILTSFMLRGW